MIDIVEYSLVTSCHFPPFLLISYLLTAWCFELGDRAYLPLNKKSWQRRWQCQKTDFGPPQTPKKQEVVTCNLGFSKGIHLLAILEITWCHICYNAFWKLVREGFISSKFFYVDMTPVAEIITSTIELLDEPKASWNKLFFFNLH